MAENVLFNMPELMEALDRGSATVEQQNAAFVLLAFAREVGDWSKVEAAMFVHLRAMNRAEIRKRPC